tara:strand:- start:19 stop:942 length:924 start_codon:yes stop_codon:yes gene_type:complete
MPRKKYDKDKVLFDPKPTASKELAPLKEVEFLPSTIETIDRSLFDYVDDTLDISCTTNGGWKKVPFYWAGAERAYQIKHNRDLRDSNGVLIYPLMTVERVSIAKDISKRGSVYAPISNINDAQGGSITVGRVIKQDKSANFANADSKRVVLNVGNGQETYPRGENKKVVYETLTMPIPVYLEATYKLIVKTEYQQQMNEILTPFMTSPGGINYFIAKKDGHRFEVFVDSDYSIENNGSSLGEDERGYKTEISFRVLGYVMGAGKNDVQPKIVRRENAVEIKMPRERVILGDINDNRHLSGNVPFYRE